MSNSEGEYPEGVCLIEDFRGSLSPEVRSRLADLALQALGEEALRECELRKRRDYFKVLQSTKPPSDSVGFDLVEQ